VHSVEHCTFLDETSVSPNWDVTSQMVNAGTFISVTAAIPGIDLPPILKARADKVRDNVERMHTMGVRIVLSSDAGVGPHKPHGVLPHGVVSATSVGFTKTQVLENVTSVAAAVCGLSGRKGAITAGCAADLRAVHGNPLAEISDIHRVAAVFRAGARVR